jgi:PTS system nitrogen regulatory IIA component
MSLAELVSPQAVVPSLRANSKKQIFLELADRAAQITGLTDREIFDGLVQREKLGTTGIGHGIAIPHAELVDLPVRFGLFARMERPLDWEATDGEPVDLIFVLLSPAGSGADHLKALALIARALRGGDLAEKLRATDDPAALYAVLTHD